MWNIISLAPPFAGGANEAPRHAMFVRDSRRLSWAESVLSSLASSPCLYPEMLVLYIWMFLCSTGLLSFFYLLVSTHVLIAFSTCRSLQLLIPLMFSIYFQTISRTSWAQHMKTAQRVVWTSFPSKMGKLNKLRPSCFTKWCADERISTVNGAPVGCSYHQPSGLPDFTSTFGHLFFGGKDLAQNIEQKVVPT